MINELIERLKNASVTPNDDLEQASKALKTAIRLLRNVVEEVNKEELQTRETAYLLYSDDAKDIFNFLEGKQNA